MSFRSVFDELRRRQVIRVASAYAIIGWLLLQVASIVLPTFGAAPWVMQGVTILLVAGFPIAIVLAWLFQVTAEGIVADAGPESVPPSTPLLGRTIDFSIIGVLAVAVLLFAYDKFFIDSRQADAQLSRRPAVAILPFQTQDDSREQRIFVDSLANELYHRLSSWRSIPVISTATSFSPKLPSDILEAGAYLDARYLLSGALSSTGSDLDFDVSVTDSTDGRGVWSASFAAGINEILSLEEDISTSIVGQISPALITAETERAIRQDPQDIDAWTAAHRGWWHVNRETEQDFEESLVWFDRAVELEPSWGWPHAAKALALYRATLNGWGARGPERNREMFELAQRAVDLDPNDAFAHHALGHAYAIRGQSEESLASLARGVELNPNDAMANGCYGMQLAAANRHEEAISVGERALSLSPDDPWAHRFMFVLTRAYFSAGDYERSQAMAIRSNQLRPNQFAMLHLIAATALSGDIDLAKQRALAFRDQIRFPSVESVERALSRSTDAEYLARLGRGLRLADFRPASDQAD